MFLVVPYLLEVELLAFKLQLGRIGNDRALLGRLEQCRVLDDLDECVSNFAKTLVFG